ncbi:pyrimidine/purine nucleoside phosphorylase [Sulfurimonas sp. HSL-1716]|uniref:pyrimidine/purine nucleoside phosphorylase n=1 Tax=Hydrocurvibacter sulfurireducens TaxID=3131937 RepID=UPI0031F9F9D1
MSKFTNVDVVKEANIYFDGKVTSRTVEFSNGEKKTLGIMQVGEYTFGTGDAEIMEILQGEFSVKLPGSDAFVDMSAPCEFNVPANSSFDIKVKTITDYCCSYIK